VWIGLACTNIDSYTFRNGNRYGCMKNYVYEACDIYRTFRKQILWLIFVHVVAYIGLLVRLDFCFHVFSHICLHMLLELAYDEVISSEVFCLR
jgi:hypothetical protein